MRMTRALLPLLILAGAAIAQDNERLLAGDVLTQELCERMRDDVMPRIELFTRMKFRRGVPMRLEPKGVWENKIKRDGFAGTSAKHALAYYTPSRNVVTVVPWVIGGYAGGNPSRRSRVAWISELEPTMIHELTHAIHHQNFYTEGRFYAASLRAGGLSEEELDRSTVDFLMGEGVPELVALRTTDFKERMHRHPGRDLPSPLNYMRKYQPDGKKAYRIKLLEHGYRDGLDLMHHLALKSGPRGIRAVLYRPPPRQLVFQPKILATVELDDPPEPDSIFGFLSPEILKGREILRATFPGHGRYFESACQPRRTKGCLIGYVATVGDEGSKDGQSRYAFFVADPDKPSPWVGRPAAHERHQGHARHREDGGRRALRLRGARRPGRDRARDEADPQPGPARRVRPERPLHQAPDAGPLQGRHRGSQAAVVYRPDHGRRLQRDPQGSIAKAGRKPRFPDYFQ